MTSSTVINNAFRQELARSLPSTSGFNLNDVVNLVDSEPPGPTHDAIVGAYIHAWRIGYWALAGVAVAQFLLCLMLRPVELDDGKKASEASDEKDGTMEGN